MTTNTMANIVAAVGAVATLITALSLLIPTLRQVKAVHTIVNQDRTDARNYTAALIRELVRNGIEVPLDQSLPDQTAPPDPHPAQESGSHRAGDPLTASELVDTVTEQAERFPESD